MCWLTWCSCDKVLFVTSETHVPVQKAEYLALDLPHGESRFVLWDKTK